MNKLINYFSEKNNNDKSIIMILRNTCKKVYASIFTKKIWSKYNECIKA